MLHFIARGTGEALILLHGNGEDCGYFQHQMAPFAARFRTIALDTRGHGASPRGTAPFTLSQFADDLAHFMDEQRIPCAHLLGFSDGANIALLFALRHPERVVRLVLNGGNLYPGGVRLRVQLPIVLDYALCAARARFDPRAAHKCELLGLMVREPRIRSKDLAALTVPTLVVAGDRDMIRRRHTEKIARAIPGSQLAILPGDHFVARENPEAFNRTVLDFLCAAPTASRAAP